MSTYLRDSLDEAQAFTVPLVGLLPRRRAGVLGRPSASGETAAWNASGSVMLPTVVGGGC
jgi:hypothetical protein